MRRVVCRNVVAEANGPTPGAPQSERRGERLLPAAAGVLGAWGMAVPYLGPVLGLELDVPARVEFVDHVVPGLVVVLSALGLLMRSGSPTAPGGIAPLIAAGLCFLGGFWMTSTHVPLIFEAGDELAPWGSVLLHATVGPAVLVVALWLLIPQLRTPE